MTSAKQQLPDPANGQRNGRTAGRFTARDLLFCILGLVMCAVGASAVGGSALNELSLVADITPAGLAISFGLFALTLLLRTAALGRALAGVAFLCFSTIAGPETAAFALQNMPRSIEADVLKVMTANIRSDNYDKAPFIDFVRAKQPDVVVVAETYAFWKLAFEDLQPGYRVAAGCTDPSACDVVILTRLASAGNPVSLPSSRVVADLALPQTLGGERFKVMGLHLNRLAPGAAVHPDLDEAAAVASSFGPLDVVAGDLNATPWGAPLRHFDASVALERHTRWLPTWPARLFDRSVPTIFAMVPIDHIYAGKSWRLVAIERGPKVGSDHYPVLATFARNAS